MRRSATHEQGPAKKIKAAILVGGGFRCLEAVLDRLLGVECVVLCYMGGDVLEPRYVQSFIPLDQRTGSIPAGGARLGNDTSSSPSDC